MSLSEKIENLKRARKAHNWNDDCLFCELKDTAIDGAIQLFADQQALIDQLMKFVRNVPIHLLRKTRYENLSSAFWKKQRDAALAAAKK